MRGQLVCIICWTLSPKFIHFSVKLSHYCIKTSPSQNKHNQRIIWTTATQRKRRLFQLVLMQTNNGHTTQQRVAYMNLKQENLRISCANIHYSLACKHKHCVCVFAATGIWIRNRRDTRHRADRLAKKTPIILHTEPLHCLDVYKVLAPFVCLRASGKMLCVW